MVFVDSCVWISYLNVRDDNHFRALRILGSLENEQIFLTGGIVFETVNYVFKKLGKDPAISALEFFESSPAVSVIHTGFDDLVQAGIIFKQHELSLTDAQIVAVMKKTGNSALVSFDKHFDQIKWVKRIG